MLSGVADEGKISELEESSVMTKYMKLGGSRGEMMPPGGERIGKCEARVLGWLHKDIGLIPDERLAGERKIMLDAFS